jgi:predicted AlkP superfamily phosphohydrolase/phosphomutase
MPWQAEPISPFTHIFRREEIYHGPWSHLAADLVLRARDGIEMKGKFNPPSLTQLGTLNGMHTFGNAMLYARGRRWPAGTPNMVDLAPTILSLMGIPIPPDLDGHALLPGNSRED